MNEKEAIELLINRIVCINTADHNECEMDCADCSLARDAIKIHEAYSVAIKALEKQVPMKPIDKSKNPEDWQVMHCPTCDRIFWNSGQFMHYQPKYCEKCGQAIDWSIEA